MTDRYPYRHLGPAVHGSKLADYLISEANMIDDLEQLRAENALLREATNQCRLAFAGYVSVQSAINKLDALSADPSPVVGVTVQDIVHHIHRLSSAGDGLDGWLNPEGIRAREKWNKVKRDALRSIAGENAIAGKNGNENG